MAKNKNLADVEDVGDLSEEMEKIEEKSTKEGGEEVSQKERVNIVTGYGGIVIGYSCKICKGIFLEMDDETCYKCQSEFMPAQASAPGNIQKDCENIERELEEVGYRQGLYLTMKDQEDHIARLQEQLKESSSYFIQQSSEIVEFRNTMKKNDGLKAELKEVKGLNQGQWHRITELLERKKNADIIANGLRKMIRDSHAQEDKLRGMVSGFQNFYTSQASDYLKEKSKLGCIKDECRKKKAEIKRLKKELAMLRKSKVKAPDVGGSFACHQKDSDELEEGLLCPRCWEKHKRLVEGGKGE